MTAPRWVPVTEALPPLGVEFQLWGTKLEAGLDHPCSGVLCACHEQWVLSSMEEGDRGPTDGDAPDPETEEYTRRMLGEVTHWLDWRPGPETSP